MTVFLWQHDLTYVSAPKVACTSLKHMFFEIENGFRFRMFHANGALQHIHNAAYPGNDFDALPHARIAGHERLTVVRDPVRRFLSCYGNRVCHHRDLAPERIRPKFRERGATPDPALAEFIDKLELYREASGLIRRHTLPLVEILGRDPGYYARIHSMDTLEDLRRRVVAVTGRDVALEHMQRRGPKISPDDLSPAQRRRIEAFYAEDYAVYGEHF